MSDHKTSANKTGTLFYTKLGESKKGYRVRFRSHQQGMFENRGLISELNDMQVNYNLFKYGRSGSRRFSQPVLMQDQPNKPDKISRDQQKESDDLRHRLKSMKENRLKLFDKIKALKE